MRPALLALLILLQLLTPTAAGWSLLKRAFGLGSKGSAGALACKVVTPQKDVDLAAYAKRWYVHQQVRGTRAD